MRPFRLVVLLLALTAAPAATAAAQLPLPFSLSLEVLPGVAVPVGDFAGRDQGIGAEAGPGIAVGAALGFGALGVYGEYQYARFGCGECLGDGIDDEVADAGWEAGLQLRLPLPLLPVTPWVRAGAVSHQLQFTGGGGSVTSERGLGYAAGAGAYLSLPGSLQLAPAVRYRSYPADVRFGEFPARDTDVAAAVVQLGLVYRF